MRVIFPGLKRLVRDVSHHVHLRMELWLNSSMSSWRGQGQVWISSLLVNFGKGGIEGLGFKD